MAFKRLPNRFGKIVKLSGKRRNPYYPMLWICEKEDPVTYKKKQIYKGLPSQATYSAALRVLTEAHREQEDKCIDKFRDVYDKAIAEHYKKKAMSETKRSSVKYLEPIMDKWIADLKAADLEAVVNTDAVPRTMKINVSTLIRITFNYAMRHELIKTNYAEIAHFEIDSTVKLRRNVFTAGEIRDILSTANDGDIHYEMLAVLIYTGMRQVELLKMRRDNVRLKEHYMIGGVKTEAGIDRIIPIHSMIRPIIEKHYKRSEMYRSDYLFCNNHGKQYNETLMVNYVSKNIEGHTSHDCRHTFTSRAIECGMATVSVDKITGHVSSGITEKIYTHLSPEYLVSEIEKLKY